MHYTRLREVKETTKERKMKTLKTILATTLDLTARLTVGLVSGAAVGAAVAGVLHFGLGADEGFANTVGTLVSIIVTGSVLGS
jgi:hypothetical protein